MRVLPAAEDAVDALPPRAAGAALAALELGLDAPLREIVITANRSSLVSLRPTRDRAELRLRLHWCFLLDADAVRDDLVQLLKPPGPSPEQRRRAVVRLRTHFSAHGAEASRPQQRRPDRLRSQGQHFDLALLRDEINRQYFNGEVEVAITWGRHGGGARRRRRARRSRRRVIRLGSYNADQRLVRIHPILDRPHVPRFVVASVVHHELLHAAMPATLNGTRRRLHPPEFRRQEALFADHQRAADWLDEHLDELLDLRDRGNGG